MTAPIASPPALAQASAAGTTSSSTQPSPEEDLADWVVRCGKLEHERDRLAAQVSRSRSDKATLHGQMVAQRERITVLEAAIRDALRSIMFATESGRKETVARLEAALGPGKGAP